VKKGKIKSILRKPREASYDASLAQVVQGCFIAHTNTGFWRTQSVCVNVRGSVCFGRDDERAQIYVYAHNTIKSVYPCLQY